MIALGLAALLAWAVLLFGRSGFWRARDTDADADTLPDPAAWPAVACIVPARDEAQTIGAVVRALLAQDYPGPFRLIVVDDRSADGTGGLARSAGAGDPRLLVVTGAPRPAGWVGKLWALQQGLAALGRDPATLLWFTDADILHAPDSLRALVRRQRAGGQALVSIMARLRCESRAERWLIPAFVFFFQLLYPFRRVRDPRSPVAAAAGGCLLIDRAAFRRAGGLAPVRGALIDDCALAARLKPAGPLWLGLSAAPPGGVPRVRSLRAYGGVGELRGMIARTAYTQLGHSPALLIGTLLALGIVFLAPPALALWGSGPARWLGLLGWAAMAVAYRPILRHYGVAATWAPTLPLAALAYMLFTLDSARAHHAGRGGAWKGESGPRDRAEAASGGGRIAAEP